jgi:pentose-5-phosphate-3-epimerase
MSPKLSAGVLTADLTRLGAELELLRGQAAWAHVDVIYDGVDPARNLDLMIRQLSHFEEAPDGKR